MIRLVASVYMFVALFDIMFFIRAIGRARRDVDNELRELDRKLDEELEIPSDDKDYFCLADNLILKWYNGWPYLLHSIIPFWHLVFFYTFLTNGKQIEYMFYVAFRGKAEQYVKGILEDLRKIVEEDEDNDCE